MWDRQPGVTDRLRVWGGGVFIYFYINKSNSEVCYVLNTSSEMHIYVLERTVDCSGAVKLFGFQFSHL